MNKKIKRRLMQLRKKIFKGKSIKATEADRYPRNAICKCGSKKKYKHCCWAKDNAPGDKFESSIFKYELAKMVTYAQKKYRKLTK